LGAFEIAGAALVVVIVLLLGSFVYGRRALPKGGKQRCGELESFQTDATGVRQ
jgi:hypothetical protein